MHKTHRTITKEQRTHNQSHISNLLDKDHEKLFRSTVSIISFMPSRRARAKRRRGTPNILVVGVFLSIYLLLRVILFDVSAVVPINDATLMKATAAATKSEVQAEAPISAIVHQPPLAPGVRGQPCRYDGHCGVGMTCAMDKLLTSMRGNSGPGSCQPFPLSKTPTTVEKSPCALRCSEGLPASAKLQQVWLSKAEQNVVRPDACVLTFRLEPGYKRSEYDDNKYNDVIKDHRIVRRDPVLNSTYSESEVIATGAGSTSNGGGTLGQILWMAICYEPCDGSCVEGFVCKDRVCRRDESYWLRRTAKW